LVASEDVTYNVQQTENSKFESKTRFMQQNKITDQGNAWQLFESGSFNGLLYRI